MEYKYTWNVSRESKVLKLFNQVWTSDKFYEPNFCILFWGYVFMPLAVILRVVSWPFRKVLKWVNRKLDARNQPKPLTYEELEIGFKKEREREKEQKDKRLRRLERWNEFTTKISMWCSNQWRWFKYPWFFFLGVASIVSIVILIYLGYLFVNIDFNWGKILESFLIFLGAIIGSLMVLTFVIWMDDNKTNNVVRNFFSKIWDGIKFFFGLLWTGVKGIKSRTCPKIVVKD